MRLSHQREKSSQINLKSRGSHPTVLLLGKARFLPKSAGTTKNIAVRLRMSPSSSKAAEGPQILTS